MYTSLTEIYIHIEIGIEWLLVRGCNVYHDRNLEILLEV